MDGQEQLDRLLKLMADLYYIESHCGPPCPEVRSGVVWVELAHYVARTVTAINNPG